MSLPRYKQYKDSGVEWLGEVPEHWRVLPLKRGYEVKLGKMLQPDPQSPSDELLPYLRAANIQWRGADLADLKQMWFSSVESDALKLRLGDLLISEGGDVGRSTLWNDELPHCCFQNSVNRVRSKGADSNRFLYYWLRMMKDKEFIDALCNKSTIAHFTAEKVGAVPVPYPPRNEQELIGSVLDTETAKIDALIGEQRRLIELLKEKRQAVISQAVTRGLDNTVPLRESGDSWLGDIPHHWTTRTIAQTTTKITNGFVGPTRDILVDEGTPYIQATHVKRGKVFFGNDYFVLPEWSKGHSKSILKERDVLIVQTGAGTGDVGLVSAAEVGFNCHALIILSPDATLLNGEYLSILLQSSYGQAKLTSIQTGAGHPHLNCGNVKFIEIPLPSLEEQASISQFINNENARFDKLTSVVIRSTFLLEERRSALISAAVTGKIDVRNYTPKEAA